MNGVSLIQKQCTSTIDASAETSGLQHYDANAGIRAPKKASISKSGSKHSNVY